MTLRNLILALVFCAVVPAHAADPVDRTPQVITTPSTTTTVIDTRPPAGMATITNNVTVEAQSGSTVIVNQPGRGGGADFLGITDTWLWGPEINPRVAPTSEDIQQRCYYRKDVADRIVTHIDAYSRVERFAIDGYWGRRHFQTPFWRDFGDRQVCEILSSRLSSF